MAKQKIIKTRLVIKHDTEENWNKAVNFIPYEGEQIIYDADTAHPFERYKIGNGTDKVADLPFATHNEVIMRDAALPTASAASPDFICMGGVLYGKTEEIIEEKYCNVTFDFFHGNDSSYPYKVYISEGKKEDTGSNFYSYDPSHLLSTFLYNEVPKTLSIKEGTIVCMATGPSDNDPWFRSSLSSTDPEIEFGANNYSFKVTKDCVIKFTAYTCLTPDTLITLSDHTQKRIDQLSFSDKVLSYNLKTQKLEEDEITYTDSKEDKEFTEYDIWTFEGGYEVKTVHRHRFYNIERQAMVYMDEWKLGEHAYTLDGKEIALLSHQNIKEKTKHHTLFTKNQNYFANGLLSGNRHTEQLNLRGNE